MRQIGHGSEKARLGQALGEHDMLSRANG